MSLSKLDHDGLDGERSVPVKISRKPNQRQNLEQARYFLSIGDPDKAEDCLRTLLVFYPDDFTALSLLGGILYSAGRYDEAIAVLKTRLAFAPDKASAHEDLALALESTPRREEAISEFLKACALSPDSARANLKLAGIYALMGEKAKAMKYFADAYAILGPDILAFAFDPVYANLKNTPGFILIMDEAKAKRGAAGKAAAK